MYFISIAKNLFIYLHIVVCLGVSAVFHQCGLDLILVGREKWGSQVALRNLKLADYTFYIYRPHSNASILSISTYEVSVSYYDNCDF